jgi:hypothetical protein
MVVTEWSNTSVWVLRPDMHHPLAVYRRFTRFHRSQRNFITKKISNNYINMDAVHGNHSCILTNSHSHNNIPTPNLLHFHMRRIVLRVVAIQVVICTAIRTTIQLLEDRITNLFYLK